MKFLLLLLDVIIHRWRDGIARIKVKLNAEVPWKMPWKFEVVNGFYVNGKFLFNVRGLNLSQEKQDLSLSQLVANHCISNHRLRYK